MSENVKCGFINNSITPPRAERKKSPWLNRHTTRTRSQFSDRQRWLSTKTAWAYLMMVLFYNIKYRQADVCRCSSSLLADLDILTCYDVSTTRCTSGVVTFPNKLGTTIVIKTFQCLRTDIQLKKHQRVVLPTLKTIRRGNQVFHQEHSTWLLSNMFMNRVFTRFKTMFSTKLFIVIEYQQ